VLSRLIVSIAVLAAATSPSLASKLVEPSLHIAAGGASAPQVALTLDACMGGADERILGELVADHVPATIFVTGRWLRHNPAAVRQLLAHPELFELEDHGENHVPAVIGSERPYGLSPAGTADAVAHEVLGGRTDLERAGGGEARWYRGATALYSPDALQLIGKLGLRVAGFSLNGDLGASVSESTAARRIEGARDGDVIISHVNQPSRPAGAGVAEGVHALVAKGYHFVRLEDVAEIGG
jgi:peptidoglycan/xylan/chitin deacetylase (PgdA/CDA1 family)